MSDNHFFGKFSFKIISSLRNFVQPDYKAKHLCTKVYNIPNFCVEGIKLTNSL